MKNSTDGASPLRYGPLRFGDTDDTNCPSPTTRRRGRRARPRHAPRRERRRAPRRPRPVLRRRRRDRRARPSRSPRAQRRGVLGPTAGSSPPATATARRARRSSSSRASALTGTLDGAFGGGDGIVLVAGRRGRRAPRLALEADGDLLVAGAAAPATFSPTPSRTWRACRLGGAARTSRSPRPTGSSDVALKAVEPLPDGRIAVAGWGWPRHRAAAQLVVGRSAGGAARRELQRRRLGRPLARRRTQAF